MSNFAFGGINTSIKKKNVNYISSKSNPLFYSKNKGKNRHVLVLIESMQIKKELLNSLSIWLQMSLGSEFDFDIVSSSILTYSRDKIKSSNIQDYYTESRSDFLQYIRPDQTIIITLGYALTAVTLNSDITVQGFYDVVFNKSYFYSPYTNTNIVPIDSPDYLFKKDDNFNWVKKDNSRQQFAEHQLYQIKTRYDELKRPLEPRRVKLGKVNSKEEFDALCERYRDNKLYPKVAWDTETSGFHFIKNRVGCMSLCFDGITGWFIPWKYVDKDKLNALISRKYQIGANLKFDCKFFHRMCIPDAYIHSDVVSLGRVLNEMRSNSLKSLAFYYTEHGGYDDELDEYKKKYKITNYLDIPESIMFPYATMDAIVTYQVEEAMQTQLSNIDVKYPPVTYGTSLGWTVRRYYEDVVVPSLNTFTKIEQVGVVVDREIWDRNSDTVDEIIKGLKIELASKFALLNSTGYTSSFDTLLPETFSFSDEEEEEDEEGKKLTSSKKLGILLKNLGWPCYGTSKQGYYLTGDEQLTRWEQDGYKEAKTISDLRSYLVLQRTFLGRKGTEEGWRRYITFDEKDKLYKIYPSYGVMSTDSGRNSSNSPNFQQIPSGALGAKYFKQIFRTPNSDNFLLLSIDKKSYQTRICSIDTYDKCDVLYQGYMSNPDLDLHSLTGYNVFAKGEKYEFVEINGKEYYSEQIVKVIRNGKELEVKAIDVLESDDLVA